MRNALVVVLALVAAPVIAQQVLVDHLWSPHGIALAASARRLLIGQPELGETDVLDLTTGSMTKLPMNFGAMGITFDRSLQAYFVTDYLVYRFDPSTSKLVVVAGSVAPPSNDPYGVFPITTGDNGPATQATLSNAQSVAVDSVGNIYIGEYKGMKVRRVDATTGIITTIAGTGEIGYGGDGGDARRAKFGPITDLLVDDHDDVLVADRFNLRVRKYDHVTGIVTTIAGDGTWDMHLGDTALTSSLSPAHLARDGNTLYIYDLAGSRIVRMDVATNALNVVANDVGTIAGLAVAPAGSLYASRYVLDYGGQIVWFAGTKRRAARD